MTTTIRTKKVQKASAVKLQNIDLTRISSALRRLALAASSNLGSDCYIHAAIAQQIILRLGAETTLSVGYAAWRVGDGNGDVILHAPLPNMPSQEGVPYHAWLETDTHVIDFTTYQLKAKAASMDALDGGTTTVTWCPDFLFVTKKSMSSFERVVKLRAGLYRYVRVHTLEVQIKAAASPLDEHDVNSAWMLYQNPELQVFGPNSMPASGENINE